jgi:uncharacterized protein YecT (DUF1311 family)
LPGGKNKKSKPTKDKTMKKIILIFLFFLPESGFCDDSLLSQGYKECMDKSEGVTSNMLDCIGNEINYQDKRLNESYRKVMSTLNPSRTKKLQEAQRAWIKYRDENCNFYADSNGGTMAEVVSSDCVLSSTASRAEELTKLLTQLE